MLKLKKGKINNLKFFIILIFFIFSFSGCNIISQNNPTPTQVDISKILAKKRKKHKPKRKIFVKKFQKKFVYNPYEITRDPFEPFIKKITIKKQIIPPNIPLTPLIEYNLAQLKFVGIIKNSKPPLALAETSDKKALIFTEGDYIGTELYKVVKILNDKIILERKFKIGNKIKSEYKTIKIDIYEGE